VHRRVAWEQRGWRGVGVDPGHLEVGFASVETGSVPLGTSRPSRRASFLTCTDRVCSDGRSGRP